MAKDVNHDLTLLDLKMPGMKGVETLRGPRKMDKDVPIYIITAFYEGLFEGLKGGQRDGIDFEIPRKPFRSEQIVLTEKSMLHGQIAH